MEFRDPGWSCLFANTSNIESFNSSSYGWTRSSVESPGNREVGHEAVRVVRGEESFSLARVHPTCFARNAATQHRTPSRGVPKPPGVQLLYRELDSPPVSQAWTVSSRQGALGSNVRSMHTRYTVTAVATDRGDHSHHRNDHGNEKTGHHDVTTMLAIATTTAKIIRAVKITAFTT